MVISLYYTVRTIVSLTFCEKSNCNNKKSHHHQESQQLLIPCFIMNNFVTKTQACIVLHWHRAEFFVP